MTAAIVCDYTIAALQEEHHLGVPIVRAQRPPVVEEKRLAVAPIFIVDLGAVFLV